MKRIFSLIITLLLISCFLIVGCKTEAKVDFSGTYRVFLANDSHVYSNEAMILELRDDGKLSFKHTKNDANGETVLVNATGHWYYDDATSDTEVYCYYQLENQSSKSKMFSLKYAGDGVLVWYDCNGIIEYYLQKA